MLLFVAVAIAAALMAAGSFLVLRVLATRVAAPKGSREMFEDPAYQRSWLEELGFRTFGELLFPGADENGPPTVVPALVSPDSTIMAKAGALHEREFTLLTAWPDGAYVVTKCPPRGLVTRRDSASILLRSARSGAEALSVHSDAVKSCARHHGMPIQARVTAEVAACYQTAAATWREQLIRTTVRGAPLYLLACAVLLVGLLVH